MKEAGKCFFLIFVGGLIYYCLEILWRGYSHWTMFLLGGICFFLCGLINEIIPWEMPLPVQMLLGAFLITLLEFNVGVWVNLYLGWQVWDYSDKSFQVMGQICLKSTLIWFGLSGVGIILDDWLRYRFFQEEKPYYRLW